MLLSKLATLRHLRPGMIRSDQCRAARALLNWSQGDLANNAGVGIVTVRQLEADVHVPRRATLTVIRGALEAAGVEFIEENGGGPRCPVTKAATEKGLVQQPQTLLRQNSQ